MHRHTWTTITSALLTLAALALVGCGGASDVGGQKTNPPTAKAVVIGQPFTPSEPPANGKISTTVRAGTEVVLSGKESDSDSLPIVRFEWSPANEDTREWVSEDDLLLLNSTTVRFTAPNTDQTLLFNLTVVNAKEQTSTAQVEVIVQGISDPDRFLSFLKSPRKLYVYTKVGTAIPRGTAIGDASFEVIVEPLLDYLPRVPTKASDGSAQLVEDEPLHCEDESQSDSSTRLPDCRTSQRWHQSITWPISLTGASSDCGAASSNPVLAFEIPVLDVDEINRRYQHTDSSKTIELRDIDHAALKARISLKSDNTNLGLAICKVTTTPPTESDSTVDACTPAVVNGAAVLSTTCGIDQLLEARRAEENATPSFDTAASAAAYYDTIDRDVKRDTLLKWFAENGFDANAPDYGADVHAVYTNNFDLGFGRDMYATKRNCIPGIEAPGSCDIASVVFNYTSLDAAAQKIGPIVAVAMEYTADQPGGQRFTKFYVFAPDLRGDFRRVKSVDLDGRGEKFVPQACVVCHGGRPGQVTDGKYAGNGDIKSGWLSWDLKSFLYSDTDQGFTKKTDNAKLNELRVNLTRTAQEEAFRKLNHYAYLTFEDGVVGSGRYDLARELVAGWYGDAGGLATPGTKWADYPERPEALPEGWRLDKHPDAPEMHEKVFAQHCRACHVIQIPGTSGQVAIGGYDDFVTAAGLNAIMQSGEMPFARLTMDRLWIKAPNQVDPSAGEFLQSHTSPAFGNPGSAVPLIDGWPGEELERDKFYRLSAKNSRNLGPDYIWHLDKPSGSKAVLAFDTTADPVLTAIDVPGSYSVRLTASDGTFVEKSAIRRNVPIVVPPLLAQIITVNADVPVDLNWIGGDGAYLADVTPGVGPISVPSFNAASGVITLRAEGLTGPDGVLVNYVVQDQDCTILNCSSGDRVTGSFTVVSSAGLTVRTSVTAYGETRRAAPGGSLLHAEDSGDEVFDLSGLATPEFTGPAFQTWVEVESAPAGLTREGNSLRYVPPAARMTWIPATGLRMEPPITSFGFRACYLVDVENGACPAGSPSGSVAIDIVGRDATANWASVLSKLNDNCASSCHRPSVPSEPVDSSPNYMGGNTGDAATFDSVCNATTDGVPVAEPGNTAIVLPGDPDSSALYRKPKGDWQHKNQSPGGQVGDQSLWDAVMHWIEDGAYFTSGPRMPQKCGS